MHYVVLKSVYFTDAAIVMLKNKIHRIPIVNEVNQVIGYYESFLNALTYSSSLDRFMVRFFFHVQATFLGS